MPDDRDPTLCPCGEGAHFSTPEARQTLRTIIEACGPTIRVRVAGVGVWAVPRAYVFLHGYRPSDVPELADRYGFERLDG